MPKVQKKYHWKTSDGKTFSEISIGKVSFTQLMFAINTNLVGIGVDVEKNRIDNAKKHLKDFNEAFQAMKETCGNCHITERKHYVDAGVQAMIDDMGKALNENPVESGEGKESEPRNRAGELF